MILRAAAKKEDTGRGIQIGTRTPRGISPTKKCRKHLGQDHETERIEPTTGDKADKLACFSLDVLQ